MTQSGQISVNEAAAILGLSRSTVLRRLRSGDILGDKLGTGTAAWSVNRADVERLAGKQAA